MLMHPSMVHQSVFMQDPLYILFTLIVQHKTDESVQYGWKIPFDM